MNHVSLFSGIAGFELAAQAVWQDDYKNIAHSEIDKKVCRIYHKHFPESECLGNIKETDFRKYRGTIDLVTGGFPCQPFSVAGKRKGKEDDRALWPEMFRAIKEIRPRWIVGENVAGIIKMELDNVLFDLESEEYATQTFDIPACAVGANHFRERIWIVAWNTNSGNGNKRKIKKVEKKQDSESAGVCPTIPNTESKDDRGGNAESIDGQIQQSGKCVGEENVSNTNNTKAARQRKYGGEIYAKSEPEGSNLGGCNVANTDSEGRTDSRRTRARWTEPFNGNWWTVEPGMGRVANGIPNRMDRLRGLGNAIVPQVVFEIFTAMHEIERGK